MSSPRNSMQSILEHAAEPLSPPPAIAAPVSPKAQPSEAKFFRPSREGRKLIAGHFEPKTAKQLKLLAAEEETTVQALLEEALDLLFVKKGRGKL